MPGEQIIDFFSHSDRSARGLDYGALRAGKKSNKKITSIRAFNMLFIRLIC